MPLGLCLASCATLRAWAPRVPHTLSATVVLDGRVVGPLEAAAEGVAIDVRRRGERAWIVVRNAGDRPRVIDQVTYEQRFAESPQAAAPPQVVVFGSRVFVRDKDAGYTAMIDAAEAGAEAVPAQAAAGTPGGARFWYTPCHALAPGETYEAHALVTLPTSLTGYRLSPAQGPFYNPLYGTPAWAPSAEALDLGEIRAVQDAVARDAPPRDRPIIQCLGDAPTDDPQRVMADIDLCADLGIEYDTLSDNMGPWAYDDPSPEALRSVFAHAQQRAVKLGTRIFVNAPASPDALAWIPHKPEWAILQADGKPMAAHCLGSAAFADGLSEKVERRLAAWPFRLLEFTGLEVAPCHATDHGHPPGEASRYAQARGAESLLRRVKDRHPDVIVVAEWEWNSWTPRLARWIDLQSFTGPEMTAMPFPGLSVVRNRADHDRRARLLTHHFRFLPLSVYPGGVVLCPEGSEETEKNGVDVGVTKPGRALTPVPAVLRYTLLQSLATCGNLRLANLQAYIGEHARKVRPPEDVAADREFLRTWIRFAYDHADLLRSTRFLTPPDVEPSNVEVYGHLAHSEGLVFVVNPNAREARARFETEGTARWTRFTPQGEEVPAAAPPLLTRSSRPVPMPSLLARNDREFDVVVPPHTVVVLRVRRGNTEDLRAVQVSVRVPRKLSPSPLTHAFPLTVDSWAGAYFLAVPERAIAWRRTEISGGFTAEAAVPLAEDDLRSDLTFGIHLIQPERADAPAVAVNGRPVAAKPVFLRTGSGEGGAADLLGGFAVSSAEFGRAARAGENKIRVEVRPKKAPAVAGGEWRSLFNGRDLDAWAPVGTAVWRVEDGVIVGTQDGDPAKAGLLTTRDPWQDFELVLEFMIDEHRTYNSGVYLRNDAGTAARTGYQVNIGSGAFGEYCGGLYLKDWKAKGDESDTIRRKGAWNELRVLAQGARFAVDLNGVRVADYTDPAPDPKHVQKGVLGLQTYAAEGHAGWVKFRNIRIRELK